MKAFIFQSVPDRLDLRDELGKDRRFTWYATRYQNLMAVGDLVFFWMGGDLKIRGIYGWGTLSSKPYIKSAWDSHGVDVLCKHRFRRPILATDLEDDPVLDAMLIRRAPQGTNFLLSDDEVTRLIARISQEGETAPETT